MKSLTEKTILFLDEFVGDKITGKYKNIKRISFEGSIETKREFIEIKENGKDLGRYIPSQNEKILRIKNNKPTLYHIHRLTKYNP